MRTIERHYQDPLELIWIATAGQLQINIQRDAAVFASWDSVGTLRIGTPETLDPDDSLAQMILHELCHALVEGPAAWSLEDWGLASVGREHRVREHACLRLQAALADRYHLRDFLAPTTNFRSYYDHLPAQPLEDDGDPAVPLATVGWQRAGRRPWSAALDRALRITGEMARMLQDLAPADSLWHQPQQTASVPQSSFRQRPR